MAAPLFYVSPTQINFQVPWEVCCPDSGLAVTVSVSGVFSNVATLVVSAFGPAIFSLNSSGSGQGAILISNTATFAARAGSIPGAQARPAQHAEAITIFGIGLGPVSGRAASGSAAPTSPLSATADMPRVTIGGILAPVDFAGMVPGLVGLYQINAQVPAGVTAGEAVPVTVSILNSLHPIR